MGDGQGWAAEHFVEARSEMTVTRGDGVKWIGNDGGWKTGHIVRHAGGMLRYGDYVFVEESCGGGMVGVLQDRLLRLPMRSEWDGVDRCS